MDALKGYCGMIDPVGILTIWDSFQQTPEIALHLHNLRVGISQWSRNMGKVNEQTVKDVVSLNFNPGEAVTTFSSAQRGISILTCHPKSAHKVETIKDLKEARLGAHTAQFNEVQRHRPACHLKTPLNCA